MEVGNIDSSGPETSRNKLLSLLLRLKMFVIPMLVGLLVAGIGVLDGHLTGAIMVAWGAIVIVVSLVGLGILTLIKAVERRST